MKSLILGTANFQGFYGIARQNKMEIESIEQILHVAQENGINHFDTARSYTDAELILGKFLNKSQPLYIDSKIGTLECKSIASITDSVKESLHMLGVPKLNTLYLHNSDLLSGSTSSIVRQGMEKVIELGLAEHLGVSVYTLNQLIEAKTIFPTLSQFQVLENLCDRRLITSNKLIELTKLGNDINIRSIFLQGLLLMDLENLPVKLQGAAKSIESLTKYATNNSVSVIDLCVAYVKTIPWVNSYLVGVESASQLRQIIKSNYQLQKNWDSSVVPLPDELKDPRFW